jgi:chromosome segregation ATPase
MENTRKTKRTTHEDERNVRGRPSPRSFSVVSTIPLETNPIGFSHPFPPTSRDPMKDTASPMALSAPRPNPLILLPPIQSVSKSQKSSANYSSRRNSLAKSESFNKLKRTKEQITNDIEDLEQQEQEVKKSRLDVRKELRNNEETNDPQLLRKVLVERFDKLNAELKQVSHEAMQSRKDVIGLTFEKNRLREILRECILERDKAEEKLEKWNEDLMKLNSESKKGNTSAEKRERIKVLEEKITGAADNLKEVMKKMDEGTIFFHARKLEWIDAEMKKLKDKRSELSKQMVALRRRRDPIAEKLMSQKKREELATTLKQYDDDYKSGGRKTRKMKKRATRSKI